MADLYIRVARWGDFQHYKDRDPKWIKNYTRLLSDDAYLSLTLSQRGLLHCIWMEYARAAEVLPGHTSNLSRRVGQQVRQETLDSLVEAGFIELVASSYKAEAASPEEETYREEREQPVPAPVPEANYDGAGAGAEDQHAEHEEPSTLQHRLAEEIAKRSEAFT